MKPVVVEMDKACTFPDCDCDSPYRAAGACAQAAERAVQLPPLPVDLLYTSSPIWSNVCAWADAPRGPGAGRIADSIDAAIKQAMQDYGQQCYEAGRAAVAALPAAPAGQPVAWVDPRSLSCAQVSRARGGPFDVHAWSEGRTDIHSVPLYATAPAAAAVPVPLTEQQVWDNDEIMSRNVVGGMPMPDLMRLVRAVEAAHGITQQPGGER